MLPALDMYYTDPAQHLITARWDPDDTVDRDMCHARKFFATGDHRNFASEDIHAATGSLTQLFKQIRRR